MVAVLILADDAQRNFRRQRIFRDRTNPLDFLYDTKASFGAEARQFKKCLYSYT